MQVLQTAFCQTCQTTMVYYMVLAPVNGIDKDVSGARLLPVTVSTYPVD